jgi:hypothetical protein
MEVTNDIQVKSKKRVADHGEVFTNEREVNAMLDLVKHETERIDSRFLEPACGNGNFLVEVLRRKLFEVERRYKSSQLEFERYSIIAVGSIYGIDLMMDNVIECRSRLFSEFNRTYGGLFKKKSKEECRTTIEYILTKNILCGNALTLKNDQNEPLVFSKWELVIRSNVKRHDYLFEELIQKEEGQLFQKKSDTGTSSFIPKSLKEFPLTHMYRLSEYD